MSHSFKTVCFVFRSSASVATGEAPRYDSFNFFECGDCGGVHNSIRATYAWHMRPLRLPRARRVRSSWSKGSQTSTKSLLL